MSCTKSRHAAIRTAFCPDCGEKMTPPVIRVHSAPALRAVAARLGVGADWHEPVDVTAVVEGDVLDNAGFWPDDQCSEDILRGQGSEMCVKLFHHGERGGELVGVVNLATLLAMACGYEPR